MVLPSFKIQTEMLRGQIILAAVNLTMRMYLIVK